MERLHPRLPDRLLQPVRAGKPPEPVDLGEVTLRLSTVATLHGIVVTVSEAPSYRPTARETEVLQALAED